MRGRYTEFQNLYLAQNCKGKTAKELTDEFNAHFGTSKSTYAIRIKLRNEGLYKFLALEGRYTEDQLNFIYVNRWENLQDLTAGFNRRFKTSKLPMNIKDVLKSRGWNKRKRINQTLKNPQRIKMGKNTSDSTSMCGSVQTGQSLRDIRLSIWIMTLPITSSATFGWFQIQ